MKWEINTNWGVLSENKVKELAPGVDKTAGIHEVTGELLDHTCCTRLEKTGVSYSVTV